MVKRKLVSYGSIGALILGAGLGIWAFVNIVLIGSKLPEGACPVTSNQPILYAAISLCVVSYILSVIEQRLKKAEQSAKQADSQDKDKT